MFDRINSMLGIISLNLIDCHFNIQKVLRSSSLNSISKFENLLNNLYFEKVFIVYLFQAIVNILEYYVIMLYFL